MTQACCARSVKDSTQIAPGLRGGVEV